jgi:ATP-binding protein involved in chromosome partitioning
MSVQQSTVLEALKVVQDPDLHRDIVSLGFIKELTIDGGRVAFTIELTTPACPRSVARGRDANPGCDGG